jgi:thiamine-phosphate pyrophosphorylase
MQIVANGTPYEVGPNTTVAAFIRLRGLDPQFVVVEWNGEALERVRYDAVTLSDGDRLELVRAVAGGSGEGARRRERLARARLYVVTGAREDRGDLEGFLDAILGEGVDIVQLREKEAEAGDLLRWGRAFAEAAGRHGALFVVNDRPDVALALGADGVHLGQDDLPPSFVRDLVGSAVLVGLSTHTPVQWAGAGGEADYLCAGPVYETPTKPGRPAAGLEYIRHAAAAARAEVAGRPGRPWFAIGGIDATTLPAVVEAGADRIVVVRAVTEAEDPAAAVRSLLGRLPPVVARP